MNKDNLNEIIEEIEAILDIYEMIEDEPLSVTRLQAQNKLLISIDKTVPDKTILPDAVRFRIIETGYRSMTDTISIYPFNDSEAADKFVNRIMEWDPEGREVLSEHLSELKIKKPNYITRHGIE